MSQIKNGKRVVTPAIKREIEKAGREMARGKKISMGELMALSLAKDVRQHGKSRG